MYGVTTYKSNESIIVVIIINKLTYEEIIFVKLYTAICFSTAWVFTVHDVYHCLYICR